MNERNERLLSLEEFAKALSISVRGLYRLIGSGELPQPVKIGRNSRLYESDLIKYLSHLKGQRA